MTVNDDLTASPTHSPRRVLGISEEGKLVLVPNTDQNRLVFDSLRPSFENPKVMPLITSSHPGKAVVLTRVTR